MQIRRYRAWSPSSARAASSSASSGTPKRVRGKTGDTKRLTHPDIGPLALIYQAFDVRGAPGQQLTRYQAEPGTPSAHARALLGSLHAPTHIENTANS